MNQSSNGNDHAEAHRFVVWAFTLSCLLLPASIYAFHTTHARLTLIPLILSASGVLAEGAWLFTYRQMKAGNIYVFPYGTKKLENALAFLDASCILLGVIYGLFELVQTVLSADHTPDLHATSLLFLFGFLGGCIIFLKVANTRKHHESPAIDVFFHIYRFAALRDLATLFLLAGVHVFGHHNSACIFWSDITICSVLLLLLGYRSVRIVMNNFSALIELPLPEPDQLLILQSLSPVLDRMERIGNIRTMKRGATRIIEVEAAFAPELENREILQMQQGIAQRLERHFPDVDFHIILVSCDESD